jgi:hypothetical protein
MYSAGSLTKIISEMWATPREGISLEALELHLKEIGNDVLEIDVKGNRIKIQYSESKIK